MKNYFEVKAKCGHVGKDRCIWITFAVVADSKKAAAEKVRQFPRVKHHHKDTIGYVKEISFEEFIVLRAENDADPYLHCKNIQEQREIADLDERISVDDEKKERKEKKKCSEYKHRKAQLRLFADLREMREVAA